MLDAGAADDPSRRRERSRPSMNTVSLTTSAARMSWVTMTMVLSSSRLATSTSSFDHVVERRRIEAAERLVHQQELLRPHELLRDRDALALAARELRRDRSRRGRARPKRSSSSAGAWRAASARGRPLAMPGDHEVAEHGAVPEQRVVLEDDADRARRAAAPCACRVIAPGVGPSSPAMMRSSRVLPTPEGPSSATTWPVTSAGADAIDDLKRHAVEDQALPPSVSADVLDVEAATLVRAATPVSRLAILSKAARTGRGRCASTPIA